MRHEPLLEQLPPHVRHTVSYCKYGFEYQKHTDIWTNDDSWEPEPACCVEYPCQTREKYGKHLAGVRTHPETGMYIAPQSLEERYRIPEALLEEIFAPYVYFFMEQYDNPLSVETSVPQFIQPVKSMKPPRLACCWSAAAPPVPEQKQQPEPEWE